MDEHGNIIIYKDKNGNDNIEVKLQDNTVWLNQEQLVRLYNSSKSNISEHIKHIFEEGELDELATVRKFRTVASNGKTYNMNYYNLDMIDEQVVDYILMNYLQEFEILDHQKKFFGEKY